MSEKNLHSTDISKNNILNILSKDLHYEKFIKKLEKRIKNLEKNVLLYVLVNNLIDSNGIWMEFGTSKYDNGNKNGNGMIMNENEKEKERKGMKDGERAEQIGRWT